MSGNTTSQITSTTIEEDCYLNGSWITGGIITPPTISTPQNDYNPTGLENSSIIRISASTTASITGLAGGEDGRRMTFQNVQPIPIALIDQSTLSSAANRFDLGGINATLTDGAVVGLIYDGIISRWRVQTATAGAATAGGLIQSQWVEVETDRSTTASTWPTPNTETVTSVATLPQATITVVDADPFPAGGGTVYIGIDDGTYQTVTYTSINGGGGTNELLGCAGGTGTVPIGAKIWLFPTSTTIAAGSDGDTLPQSTINVADASLFPTSGTILIDSTNGTDSVDYTGTTATTFTGCTGGTGVISTGGSVVNISSDPQDILTIALHSNGGALILNSTISASNETNNAAVIFHLMLDGIIIRGSGTSGNGSAPGGSSVIGVKLENIPAGDHFVSIRWRVSSGTGVIFVVTEAEINNGSLLVQEVSS